MVVAAVAALLEALVLGEVPLVVEVPLEEEAPSVGPAIQGHRLVGLQNRLRPRSVLGDN